VSKGNKGTSAQGQGVVTTKDVGEKANYTFIHVGKTDEDKPVVCWLCSGEYRLYREVSIS